MKRIVCLFVVTLIAIFALVSCNNDDTKNSDSQPPHTHVFGDWINVDDATCTTDGLKVRVCSCGDQEVITIKAKGHICENLSSVEPTCTEIGYTVGVFCTVCKETILNQTLIPAIGHSYGNWEVTLDPTSSSEGILVRKCAHSSEHIEEQSLPTLEDGAESGLYIKTITEPSYYVEGRTVYILDIDDQSFKWEFAIPVLSYPYGEKLDFISNDDGTCEVGRKEGCEDDFIVIPTISPDGERVVGIGYEGFAGMTSLKTIIIPEGIEYFSMGAFDGCSNLENLTIPDSVKSVLSNAFSGCTKLTVEENGIIYVGNWAVDNKPVSSVSFREGTVGIASFVLSHCGVRTVYIPSSVKHIGSYTFYNCASLESIVIDKNNTAYTNIDGNHLYSKDKTVMYRYAAGNKDNSFVVPEEVVTIASDAFLSATQLEKIVVLGNTKNINFQAFGNCSKLTEIQFSEGVEIIGQQAFSGCYNLTTITIPSTIKEIEEYAFYDCEYMSKVYINDLAAWCNIEFADECSNPLCWGANLYLLNEGKYSLVTELVIPESIEIIKEYSFVGCLSIKSVIISDGVKCIGEMAFLLCESIEKVVIPKTINLIDGWAFDDCNSLTKVFFAGSEIEWGKITIGKYNDSINNATIEYNYVYK